MRRTGGLAGGADGGRRPALGVGWAQRQVDLDHLRDDLAGFFDQHRVAHAHVAARDVVEVVQRGARDDGSAKRERG